MPFTRRLLHAFAVFTAVYTFVVVASGGLVTSHGAGMAVPDWPNTFGYNMFLFPVSKWVGGIFFEHSHRLLASLAGMFSIASCIGVWRIDSRRWVKILATAIMVGIGIQGLLGGLRVTENNPKIGIFHGMFAQSIFVALGVLAVVLSGAFVAGRWAPAKRVGGLRWLALALVAVVFAQLGIAATMRHAHAGLSIPDFPLAYGQILPDTSPASIAAINAKRDVPTTAALIWLQMAHRFVAFAILALVAALAWRSRAELPGVRRMAFLLVGMVTVQIALGICTIWFNKPADVATAHQALGALTLVVAGLLAFRLLVMEAGAREETLEFSSGAGYSRVSA